MVESLKQLNQLCQKPDYKTVGNWYVRNLLRPAALPVTWLLLHTSITANQVTIGALLLSFVAACFLAIQGTPAFLAGALLLQLWYYLDHVDGQIARYRKTASLTGRFLDYLSHHLVHTVVFFSLGMFCYSVSHSLAFILWGYISALFILTFNIIHDVKYKTFFEKLFLDGGCFDKTQQGTKPIVASSMLKKTFSILHWLCEIHVMINTLTLAAAVQSVTKCSDLRMILFVAYGVIAPGITLVQLVHIIKNKRIDVEYRETFRIPTE